MIRVLIEITGRRAPRIVSRLFSISALPFPFPSVGPGCLFFNAEDLLGLLPGCPVFGLIVPGVVDGASDGAGGPQHLGALRAADADLALIEESVGRQRAHPVRA